MLDRNPKTFSNVHLDEYVILLHALRVAVTGFRLPNHVHGIMIFTEPVGAIHESPLHMTQYQRRIMKLSKIIGRFKMITAKEINILRKTQGFSERNLRSGFTIATQIHIIRGGDINIKSLAL